MASPTKHVDLGFVQNVDDKWKLFSHYFPSKVGGKPAWLALKPLPDVSQIRCGICKKPCVFLLQVYAPLEEKETCFHRTIFVFVCRDPQCSKRNDNRNVKVFRSQLGKVNEFYSSEPPDDSYFNWNETYPKAEDYQSLCCVCGCFGQKKCSKCHRATYCSKDHQVIDWKSEHRLTCKEENSNSGLTTSTSEKKGYLFPEYELVTEEEEESAKEPEKSEAEKMADYKKYLEAFKEKGSLLSGKGTTSDLENMTAGLDIDREFLRFRKKVDPEPEQVLRYQRNGEPLWVSAEHMPGPDDIPKCSCGADRKFEFQVMPQLLYHLRVDNVGASLDWGTLVVYTCSDSCEISSGYQEEFVWKQDFAISGQNDS